MKKKEFLEELEEHLVGLSGEDVKEILEDYREHFRIGKKNRRKESEICASLGNPKQIAREARKELGKGEDDLPMKTHLIEVWVEMKKFAKKIFKETKVVINNTSDKFQEFVGESKEKKRGKTSKKKASGRVSGGRVILVLLFNLLIFLWIWISFFATLISLLISGFALIISGALIIAFSVFSLISYANPALKDILFSALFAGAGIVILGNLLTDGFGKLTILFLKFTKGYFKLNMRLIRK
jgi:uncharacterized membrane protein